jgi:ribosomal-protein-alanine N-acetyltransferase
MNLPPYPIFPVLANEEITLREVSDSDLDKLIEISVYDSFWAKNLEEAAEIQKKINRDYNDANSIHWCIVDNSTNEIVGTCGFHHGFDNKVGEVGCILLNQYRARGFMTRALELVISFGFKVLGLDCIRAITNFQNERAIKLLRKLNFVKNCELQDGFIEFRIFKNIM